jgi:predicted ATPase
MNRLSRLSVSGFKSIREIKDLELGALNVLIGPNGAGKSNLLSSFRMLGAIAQQRLQLFIAKEGGANAILHYGRKRTPELVAKVHVDAGGLEHSYSVRLSAVPPDLLIVLEEVGTLDEGTIRSGGSFRETSLVAGPSDSWREAMDSLSAYRRRVYHFHDTSPEAAIKQGCQLNDNHALRDDGGNLAAFLYMLRQAHRPHYEQIRDTVRLAAPFFDDFVLEPDALNPNMIHLEWRERGSDLPFFAHQLSDGTLRLIALATALLQPVLPQSPYTIVIDEPELGLHPYAITLLAALMRSASHRTQIIVATQSVTLLEALAEPEEVIVVDRKGSESTFTRLDPVALQSWLEEYTLGELWEKNVLGGRP